MSTVDENRTRLSRRNAFVGRKQIDPENLHPYTEHVRGKTFSESGSGKRVESNERRVLVDSGNVNSGEMGTGAGGKKAKSMKTKILDGISNIPVHLTQFRKATPGGAVPKRRKSAREQKDFQVQPPERVIRYAEPMEVCDMDNAIHSMLTRVPRGVVDIDARDKDPFMCSEYAKDIMAYAQCLEQKWMLPTYFLDASREVTPHMRSVLFDWLTLVQEHLELMQETLHVCCALIDRFLTRCHVGLDRMQLLGVACLFIAAKLNERFSPEISTLIHLTDHTYSAADLILMEREALKGLKFDLNFPTPLFFLDRLALVEEHERTILITSQYLLDLTLTNIHMVQFQPSLRAASALFLARQVWDCREPWTLGLAYYSKYSERDIVPCYQIMVKALAKAPKSKFQGTQSKYSTSSKYNVSSDPRLTRFALLQTRG